MTMLLVDGPNILVRAIKAMQYHPLSSSEGVPTAALAVFINTLSQHVRDTTPKRLVVCWDGGGSAERLRLYDAYKANRAGLSKGESERDSFGLAARFLTLSDVTHVMELGVEADDLIAYHVRHRPEKTVILSNDKDFRQLIADDVELIRVSGGGAPTDRWTRKRINDELGCEPEHLTLAMALCGDTSDNIPGVPRFGEKTAIKTLARYGWDLDRVLDEDPRLEGHRGAVLRNLALVDLITPLDGLRLNPPPIWTPTEPGHLLWDALVDFLIEYDMHSVLGRLRAGSLWRSARLPI